MDSPSAVRVLGYLFLLNQQQQTNKQKICSCQPLVLQFLTDANNPRHLSARTLQAIPSPYSSRHPAAPSTSRLACWSFDP